jgi:2-polyprenyl-3-methyl-5-hydroxy-6-metoxy-1,4-benzoquinol methylase
MPRRTGDQIPIEGNYQYRALTSGSSVQRFWHQAKLYAVEDLLPVCEGEFVLDFGCGSGVLSGFLSGRGARVLGVDANPAAIQFAKSQFGSDQVEFRLGLIDEEFKLDTPFDKAYCLEVIEHVYPHQGKAMLLNLHRLLRPGGQLLLTTPNYRSIWPIIELGLDHFSRVPPMKGDQHVARYNPQTLKALVHETGFEIETICSICLLAPWTAPLSWALARRIYRWELRMPFLWGSILVLVARKP